MDDQTLSPTKESGVNGVPRLQGAVKSFMINRLDTTIHSAFPAIQEVARSSIQNPKPSLAVAAPQSDNGHQVGVLKTQDADGATSGDL